MLRYQRCRAMYGKGRNALGSASTRAEMCVVGIRRS